MSRTMKPSAPKAKAPTKGAPKAVRTPMPPTPPAPAQTPRAPKGPAQEATPAGRPLPSVELWGYVAAQLLALAALVQTFDGKVGEASTIAFALECFAGLLTRWAAKGGKGEDLGTDLPDAGAPVGSFALWLTPFDDEPGAQFRRMLAAIAHVASWADKQRPNSSDMFAMESMTVALRHLDALGRRWLAEPGGYRLIAVAPQACADVPMMHFALMSKRPSGALVAKADDQVREARVAHTIADGSVADSLLTMLGAAGRLRDSAHATLGTLKSARKLTHDITMPHPLGGQLRTEVTSAEGEMCELLHEVWGLEGYLCELADELTGTRSADGVPALAIALNQVWNEYDTARHGKP